MKISLILMMIILGAVLFAGCSQGTDVPVTLPQPHETSNAGDAHQLWGLWQFTADPVAGTLAVVPLRSGEMHLNALPFLEPPALVNLTLESVQFNGNIIDANIGLRHPFIGLDEFTGFDVNGIFISDGTQGGFDDPDLVMARAGDTRLDNPDGYSRWWDPSEFPHDGSMFSYTDGLLGSPDSLANFSGTLNGYKSFSDDLTGPDDIVTDTLDPSNRCVFRAGHKNIRHYRIILDAGLVFNYAVDASWKFPNGTPPYDVPGDFPPEANRPEAWAVSVAETENTFWNDGISSGGGVSLRIDVWDHQNAGMNTVRLESPGNFIAPVESSVPVDEGDGYATYILQINDAHPVQSSIDILISVESEIVGYQGMLPGKTVTAYFKHSSAVGENPPANSQLHIVAPNGGESLTQGCPYKIEWTSSGDPISDVKLEYSTDNFISQVFPIIDSTPNSGSYDWDVPTVTSSTVRIRVSDVLNPTVKDTSDADFTISTPGEPIWGKYKFDGQNSGQSPYTGPTTDNIAWTFNTDGQATPGPSIGWDGTIYIGTNNGTFQAINPDGSLKYSLDLGSFVLGTPAIAPDNTVYAGSWGPGRLYAIGCDGTILWQFDTQGDINKCHPAIADDGTIYIGNNLGRFWAINPDGTEKWHYDSAGGYVPSPAIGPDGEVYFTMTGGKVYGFHDLGQASYDLFWLHTFTGEYITNGLSVDDTGVVYVCGLYLNTVWACDPYTDTILWTFDAPASFDEASVTIGPDYTIYIGCNDNKMYAVNPGGSVKWAAPVADRVPSSVIIDPAGNLYFGTRGNSGTGGDFYCLDSADGSLVWSYHTGQSIRGTAAISNDGTLYIGGHDSILKAFRD